MSRQRAVGPDRDRRDEDLAEDIAATTADPCTPLAEEVETMEEQIALLEVGLSGAPGAQRAALAKEINEYREELDSQRRALRQCCGERG